MKAARVVPERSEPAAAGWRKTKIREVSESASVSSPEVPRTRPVALGALKAKSKRVISSSNGSLSNVSGPASTILTPIQAKIKLARRKVAAVLDNKVLSIAMSLVTVFALFGDDFRACFFPVSADLAFSNVSFFVMCLYIVELLLNCFAKPDYVGGFYFWLDLVSTLSLTLDVSWYVCSFLCCM